MKLTPKSIRNLKLSPTDPNGKIFFDDALPGFGVRLWTSGAASFYVQYSIGRKVRRKPLGDVKTTNIGKARSDAKDILAAARNGKDPIAEKATARQHAAETFGTLLPRFLTHQRAKLKPRSYEQTERHLLAYVKAFHGMPVKHLDRRTIATRLIEIAEQNGPSIANRVRASLSAYFTWLARAGYVDANPVHFATKAVENGPREHVPSDADVAAVWQALDDSDYGAILKLLLLTGMRRSEVADLRWSEIDLDDASIKLAPARTKFRREHIIPLSGPVLAILKARSRRTKPDGTPRDHVFGKTAERGFSGWSKGRRALDTKLVGKVAPFVLHDFRRYLSSTLHAEPFAVQPAVVEALLGHTNGSKIASTYNRASYRVERQSALDRWAEHIMGLVTGERMKADVVARRRRQ